jgi:inorganic pyrophosphatase
MNLDRVNPGRDVPGEINVIIEIPAHSDPVKYEVDKETGAMFVDRFMGTAMHYPANYGYIPHSLSEDGDPLDVLVITPVPLISGSVMRCRPVSLLNMTDDSGPDPKVVAVPLDAMTSLYRDVQSTDDLPKHLLQQITHFYQHYKDLEENKWVKIEGWQGHDAACQEILASIERYNEAPVKPCF